MPGTRYRLVNLRSGRALATRLARAETLHTRMVGLLGRDGLESDEGLWIEPCSGIHTFFMRFAIDAAFLDRRRVVVRAAENLRPWQVAFGGFRARSVVELPAGSLRAGDVRVGDELGVEPA